MTDVWVSPSGSDAAAGTQTAPVQSFAKAYEKVTDGATVHVAKGNYPAQLFAGRGNQAAQKKKVTFLGDAGNVVAQLQCGADDMTFDGINVDAGGKTLSTAAFENGGGARLVFKNGAIGNVVDNKGALVDGPNIVFDNVRIHDVVLRTDGVHLEGIFAANVDKFTLRNCVFINCGVMDIFFKYPDYWSPPPPPYGGVTIEGNQFGHPVGTYAVYVTAIGSSIANSAPMTGWTWKNNQFDAPVNIDCPIGSGNTFCGNKGQVDATWQKACSGTTVPPDPVQPPVTPPVDPTIAQLQAQVADLTSKLSTCQGKKASLTQAVNQAISSLQAAVAASA